MIWARSIISMLALCSMGAHVTAAPSYLAREAEPELDKRGFAEWLATQPWWHHFTNTATVTATNTISDTASTTSTTQASPTSSEPTTPPPSATLTSDQQTYLDAHNNARRAHGAQDLVWSDTLASAAQNWANGCKFAHSNGAVGPYGENLAAGTGNFTIQAAVKLWTDEAAQYNPNNPVASHFTQVVWKSTTELGCAHALCDGMFQPPFGKAHFYVCEYSPPGNVIGQFSENVQP